MVKTMQEEINYRLVLIENTEDDTVEFKRVSEKEYAWLMLKQYQTQDEKWAK